MHKQSLLPSAWKIPEPLRDRLGDQPGRQRVMETDGHLLLVLHAPPQQDDRLRQGCYLWRKPDGEWLAAGELSGRGAIAQLIDQYEATINALSELEESASGSRDYFEVLNRLTPLARATRHLYATLQDARKKVPEDRRLILARDRAYVLSRRTELLEADAKNALDFAIARRAEETAEDSHQMARAAHRLNLLVAFFFPVATLTAIFGVNLGHGLEQWDQSTAPLPLVVVLITGLLLGTVLTAFVTNQQRRET